MRRFSVLLAFAVLGAAIFLAACGGDDNGGTGGSTATTTRAPATASGAPKVSVNVQDFSFSPSAIPAGGALTLTLKNDGKATHNFSIDSLNINVDIKAGESKTVDVPALTADTEFYCVFHKSSGMTGKITVGGGGAGSATTPASTSSSSSGGYGAPSY